MPPFEITTSNPAPPEISNAPQPQSLVPMNLNIDPHRDTYVIRGAAGVARATAPLGALQRRGERAGRDRSP